MIVLDEHNTGTVYDLILYKRLTMCRHIGMPWRRRRTMGATVTFCPMKHRELSM